jgi:uncharacterized membrane protein YbhN (UPF0104 family)
MKEETRTNWLNFNLMKNFQNKAKIVKVGKIIRNILFAGLAVWMIMIPVVLLPIILTKNSRLLPVSLYLQCGAPIVMVLGLVINLKLFRFFDRLQNGHLFDAQTVGCLDTAGKWWVAAGLFEVLFYQIGHAIFQITNAWNFSNLFAGLTLIFVAWLLKEAQELQEEQALTV